jgi:hypothetical protein
VGSAEIGAKMPTEVNSLCPNPLLLIALHSPHGLLKTGLRLCHPEKSRDSDALQVWHAKPRRVRKLQIAKAYQRISHQNPTSEFATSPVSIRHPFDAEQRTQGDSWPKMVTLRASEGLI